MPANWDLIQYVNIATGRIEWPTGPITGVAAGFEPTWVQAWVVQGGLTQNHYWAGSSQSSTESYWSGFEPGTAFQTHVRWTATEPGWKSGKFKPGTASAPQFAVGIALLALRDNLGNDEYEWWHEVVSVQ